MLHKTKNKFAIGMLQGSVHSSIHSLFSRVACKNTATPLLEGGVDAWRGFLTGWAWGSGSHTNTVVALLYSKWVTDSPLKKLMEME